MNYPVKCNKCNQLLYGPTKYCPFCGTASFSVAATSEKKTLDTLRSEINSPFEREKPVDTTPLQPETISTEDASHVPIGITNKGEWTNYLRTLINEGVYDRRELLLELKKNFPSLNDDTIKQKLADCKNPKYSPFKPNVAYEDDNGKFSFRKEIPELLPTPEQTKVITPIPKPQFWKVFLIIGIVVVLVGLFHTKKSSVTPQAPIIGPEERKDQQKKHQRKEQPIVEQQKPQVKRRDIQRPATVPNLNEEREKIRREAERETLGKVEAERQRQDQLARQKEIENQRQEQAAKQREIDDYLSDGIRFFNNGKYELCIEKMKEVVRKDNNNQQARQYIKMARDKINDIRNQFSHPVFGGSE